MTNKALFIGLAAIAVAAPAAAQQTDSAAAFVGPRIEAKVGYEFVNSGVRGSQEFAGRGRFGAGSSGEDVTGGVEAGFDHQVGRLTLGAYAGVDFSHVNVTSPAGRYSTKTSHNLDAGVRVGLPIYAGVLGYVKGGYSVGRNKVQFLTGANQTLFNNYKRSRGGYHVGGGFEFPIEKIFYAKFEYVYSQYKKYHPDATTELPFARHQVLTGLGVRF